MMQKGKIGKLVVDVTTKVAAASAGEASWWCMHQPKEPEALKKYVEQNKK
ncbi:MAG: cyclic lactone autoinducer peptide [Lachnospiraceae bacterium]|nr:cyclic lactone autoinducer peptide [Lachnospiraceae bacterium]